MNTFLLYLTNNFVKVLPSSRFFGLRNFLYSKCGVQIGKNAKLMNIKILTAGQIIIGDNTFIGENTYITGGCCTIKIGNNCDISHNVTITSGTHEIDPVGVKIAGKDICREIKIGDGVWIGIGSIILPGITIGNNALIAAGSVVTREVPPYSIVGGNPAKIIKKYNTDDRKWEKS